MFSTIYYYVYDFVKLFLYDSTQNTNSLNKRTPYVRRREGGTWPTFRKSLILINLVLVVIDIPTSDTK